jgi:hypothetical protein
VADELPQIERLPPALRGLRNGLLVEAQQELVETRQRLRRDVGIALRVAVLKALGYGKYEVGRRLVITPSEYEKAMRRLERAAGRLR